MMVCRSLILEGSVSRGRLPGIRRPCHAGISVLTQEFQDAFGGIRVQRCAKADQPVLGSGSLGEGFVVINRREVAQPAQRAQQGSRGDGSGLLSGYALAPATLAGYGSFYAIESIHGPRFMRTRRNGFQVFD